jgi:hypothetical protein
MHLAFVFAFRNDMTHLKDKKKVDKNNNNNNNNHHPIAATIFILAVAIIVTLITTTMTTTITIAPAAATTTSNTTTTTTTSSSPSGIELSPQPVYQRRPSTTGVTAINQTHIHSTFSANGTLTLPNTTETINTTSNGSALTSLRTQSAIAKETIMTEDGETVTATFYEIVGLTTGGGNGIAIAVLHTNSTDRLAPLNGMIVVGTDYMQPIGNGLTTYWEWIPTPPPSLPPTTMEESPPPSPMNTSTTADATASDTNATAATGGEEAIVEEAVGGAEVAE